MGATHNLDVGMSLILRVLKDIRLLSVSDAYRQSQMRRYVRVDKQLYIHLLPARFAIAGESVASDSDASTASPSMPVANVNAIC